MMSGEWSQLKKKKRTKTLIVRCTYSTNVINWFERPQISQGLFSYLLACLKLEKNKKRKYGLKEISFGWQIINTFNYCKY